MAENENQTNELNSTSNSNTSNSNISNETQISPMQLVQTKPLSTMVQFSEDKGKKSDGKESGN